MANSDLDELLDEPLSRGDLLVRASALGLSAGALSSLLSGAPGAAAAVGRRRPLKIKGVIETWHNPAVTGSGVSRLKWLEKNAFQPFERKYPGVDVKAITKADLYRVQNIALQAGKGPDVISVPGAGFLAPFVKADQLLPLNAYSQRFGWKDKILPWALNSARLEGKIWALPTSYETMVIFYNKTLFRDKGWKPPTTRAELEAIAKEAERDGLMVFTSGNAEWQPTTEWFVSVFLNHYAGPQAVFEALTGRRRWTDPLFLGAIDLMNRWFQRGWFGGGVTNYFANKFEPLYRLLADGKAAMNMEGTWFMANAGTLFREAKTEWDWFPIPALREGVRYPLYALGIGGAWAINAKSDNPDAVAAWLDWWFSNRKLSGRAMAAIDQQPLPVPYQNTDFPRAFDWRIRRQIVEMNRALQKGNFGYITWTFWPAKSEKYLSEEMDKVLAGKLTPKEYLEGLDKLFREERKQGRVPPIIPRP